MAIVKMKKLTIAAPLGDRDGILNSLQSLGNVHLIDLNEENMEIEGIGRFIESTTVLDTEVDYNRIKYLYDFLKEVSTKKEGFLSKREVISKEEFEELDLMLDWRSIYSQAKEIDDTSSQIKSSRAKMISLVEQYSQWKNLDVSINELKKLKRTAYFIGTLSERYSSSFFNELKENFPDVFVEKISEKSQDIAVFILCHLDDAPMVSDVLKKYGFTKTNIELDEIPQKKIERLNNEIGKMDNQLKDMAQKRRQLAEENFTKVEMIYDYISNKLEKERAIAKLVKTKTMFILQGWVPEDEIKNTQDIISKKFKDSYIVFDDPEEDENYPVALKNNAIVEPFEIVTSMYALPLPTEVDPTPVIAPFFMLFFGMMMADIGYGVVMLLGGALALKFMDLDGNIKKMVKLILYCSIPTIIFGALYGSFFGGIIKLTPLWVDPVNSTMNVLAASIVIGIIHLFTGLGVKAYQLIKTGHILDAVYDVLFWYLLIIGLILLFMVGGTAAKVLSIIGALGLLFTQGRSNKSIAGKFFGGLYGLYGITGYLGDALSYSRLLALGLASGLIGWSFNLLIGLLGKGIAAIIFGPIIFAAGHTFNFLVGGLGTFVHTCRLQYLEFFGKFYEGGGIAFQPLKIETKFIKVNSNK